MIVAYSRPPNIGNILSYRNLPDTGPQVSTYASRGSGGLVFYNNRVIQIKERSPR